MKGAICEARVSGSRGRGVTWCRDDIRLNWITQSIQEILNLPSLLPNRIKRTRVIHSVSSAWLSKGGLSTEIVPSRSTDLCHCRSPAGRCTKSLYRIRCKVKVLNCPADRENEGFVGERELGRKKISWGDCGWGSLTLRLCRVKEATLRALSMRLVPIHPLCRFVLRNEAESTRITF